MAEENPLNWMSEPDESYKENHSLYRGVKRFLWATWPDLDEIYPTFFTISQAMEGLSTDWSKYSTPDESLKNLPGDDPNLSDWGIVELKVGDLRKIIKRNNFLIKLKHDPIRTPSETLKINRAHTLLTNFNKEGKQRIRTRIRVELSLIASWASAMKPNPSNNVKLDNQP